MGFVEEDRTMESRIVSSYRMVFWIHCAKAWRSLDPGERYDLEGQVRRLLKSSAATLAEPSRSKDDRLHWAVRLLHGEGSRQWKQS
ncbi:hypothetical protein LCGC14_1608750, partial [marine sediment metagenome]